MPTPRIGVFALQGDVREHLRALESLGVATLLASCPPRARRDIYLITAEPGSARESDPHMPGVVEHVFEALEPGTAAVMLSEHW